MEVLDKWEKIEENIGVDNLEQFFRYSSLAVSMKNDLYERVIEYTDSKSSKTSVDFFEKFSNYYKQIINPNSFLEDEKEGVALNELIELGVTQAYSIILAGFNKYNREEMLSFIKYVVNFTFRYSTICNKNPNRLERLYAELAYGITNNGLDINSVKAKINDLNPSEMDYKNSFETREFKTNKIPRYILVKIEEHISSKEKKVDIPLVHLEHIMPIKIDKWIKDDQVCKNYYKKYIYNIGNMVILSAKINTSIKNDLFKNKKSKYGGSEINLIRDIKNKNEWTNLEIEWNLNRYYQESLLVWCL